jgi:DNA-binding MarR family transcriptional regulator
VPFGQGFSEAMHDEMLASLRSLRRAAEGAAVIEGANAPDGTGDDPVFGLPLLLHLTHTALLKRIRPTLSAHGFSEPRWRALRVLQGRLRYTGSEIVQVGLLSSGRTMNRIADALFARGLIRRDTLGYRTARDKPRKRFMIEIAPKGRETIAEVEAQFRLDCADLFARLDEARLARLVALLRRFATAALWVKDGSRRHPFDDTYAQCRASARAGVKCWQALVKQYGENAPRRRAKPKMEGVFWTWPGMPKRKGLAGLDPIPVGTARELRRAFKPDP